METLKYRSDKFSELNVARLRLWVSKYMLGHANKEPMQYSKPIWMAEMNRARANLRKVARKVRADLADYQARAGK